MNEERIRKAQGARLKRVRIAAGFASARSAALEAGWPESTYRAHELGSRTIDPRDAERYVRWFRLRGIGGETYTGRWIIYGDDDELTDASLDDLVVGESPDFRRQAYQAILELKNRRR